MPNVEDQVKGIVQSWAGMSSEPESTDTLGNLWGNRSVPFSVAANDLAGQLDDELGAQIQGSDLTTATTVADIVNDVLS
jgi:acyl carrier protein